MQIEYRLRPVTRYVVTRWQDGACQPPDGGPPIGEMSSQIGEYDSSEVAYEVAYAMAKQEQFNRGWHPGDGRIKFHLLQLFSKGAASARLFSQCPWRTPCNVIGP